MLAVMGLFALLFALVVTRAVDLSVLRGPEFARRAGLQHHQRVPLIAHRGAIVDRNGDGLALSVDAQSVGVRPRLFVGQEPSIRALAEALGLPVRLVRTKVSAHAPFVWLKRQVLPREVAAVDALGLRGVSTQTEGRRFYPHGMLAAHVLGAVGTDAGLEGIEQAFDSVVTGRPHFLDFEQDARQGQMLTEGLPDEPQQGSQVELTIDAAIQDVVERELAAGVAAAKAAGGAVIVLDPKTGEVLALANVPTFNPNVRGAWNDARWRQSVRNRTITDPYEPGSTFKAILAAAALEQKIVTPAEMFNCENGRMQVGRWTVHDAHPHGWLSFAEVIQYSSNIGASKVGERLGRERFYEYLRAFGFGARTGIELPGESPGIMRPMESWSRIDLVTHSYGQGVSVTPIQMAAAFATIANGGTLMRPFIIRRVVAPSGAVTLEKRPQPLRRVVSQRTAATTTELLRRVVEEEGGTGSKARLDDFSVAGKTGTAQKPDGHGGYSAKRVGSFVGFVPAGDPRLVILVLIDEPTTATYGGVVAAPVFRGIATTVLKQLGVEPPSPTTEMAKDASPATRAPTLARVLSEALSPAVAQGAAPGTPRFLGLSLRVALTRAQADGWKVETSGSGYVAEQLPTPGATPPADRRLRLRLRAGDAGAAP